MKIKLKSKQIELIKAINNEKMIIERREKDLIDFILSGLDEVPETITSLKLDNDELLINE